MIFNRTELLDKISILRPGLISTQIESTKNIYFTGQDLIVINEQMCIIVPFETDFIVSVNYKDLLGILTKLNTDDVKLVVEDNLLLITSSTENESTNAGLAISSMEQIDESLGALYSQMPNYDNGFEWSELPTDFIDGMLLCIPAADTTLQLHTLACLYVKNDTLLCTDNNRISHYTLNNDLKTEFFIHAGVVKELKKFEIIQFYASKSWVFFTTYDDIVIAIKKLYGGSLDMYTELFNNFKGDNVELPTNMKNIVKTASTMSNTIDGSLDITIQNGKMVCTTQNERGWITKKINIEKPKKDQIELLVSASHLQQILDLPDLKMIVGKDKSLFMSGNFKHILMHHV